MIAARNVAIERSKIIARSFLTADLSEIAQISAAEVRKLRNRFGVEGDGTGTRTNHSLSDVVLFYLLQLLRSQHIKLSEAWSIAEDPEINGAMIVKIGLCPGAVEDKTTRKLLTRNRTYINQVAFDLANRKSVAGGQFFLAWSVSHKPTTYVSAEQALAEMKPRRGHGPAVIIGVDLAQCASDFLSRAGMPIAALVDP